MIKWLARLPIFKSVYRLGGIDSFPLAQKDILETMVDDLEKKAEFLAKKKLNDLLSPVDLTAIVGLNKQEGAIYIGGIRADDIQLANLKAEADALSEMYLWHLLQETPKELAQISMFVAGESLEDMKKGRSILYTLSSQRNIIDLLRSYKPKPPVDTTPKTGV